MILLDEIDKLTRNAMFNPSGAMLELLDPEQNHTFKELLVLPGLARPVGLGRPKPKEDAEVLGPGSFIYGWNGEVHTFYPRAGQKIQICSDYLIWTFLVSSQEGAWIQIATSQKCILRSKIHIFMTQGWDFCQSNLDHHGLQW